MELHFIVNNLLKIMKAKDLSKVAFAEKIGFDEPKWNKISNGRQNLSVRDLSKIAEGLGMREIDIITYPDEYVDTKSIRVQAERFFVAFEVPAEKRDLLLKSVLDDEENCKIVSNYKVNS